MLEHHAMRNLRRLREDDGDGDIAVEAIRALCHRPICHTPMRKRKSLTAFEMPCASAMSDMPTDQ